MAHRPFRPDPGVLRGAIVGQYHYLVEAAHSVPDDLVGSPAGLGDWSVLELLDHLAATVRAVSTAVAGPTPKKATLTALEHLTATMAASGHVAHRSSAREAGLDAAGARANLVEAVDEATRVLGDRTVATDDRVVETRAGAMRLTDLLVTRLVETVVHAGDLQRALIAAGIAAPTFTDVDAVRICVRVFADLLATVAPGRSVELRVVDPSLGVGAAVQCVAGPRHTRGTPSGVVEVFSAHRFIELAAGRTSWAEMVADGTVRASGERTDLSGYLPLLP